MSTISVDRVAKEYISRQGAVTALTDINLKISEGEFVCVVGPSGCGKSSLLYMIGGFLSTEIGEITVDGNPIVGPGIDRGIVFQQYALFPWLTVEENIAYGLKSNGVPRLRRKAIVDNFTQMVGLAEFKKRYPRELSGGMQQRVALARTLAYDPKILLLDEPFGALDAQTRETMQDELLNIWKSTKKTVLMVTHDVDEAVYLSQRVLVMSNQPGRIVKEFIIDIDRNRDREETMLSEQFGDLRNEVWLAVRQQISSGKK